MYDILIKNARIADGTGNPMYYADVAVQDGKIARISKVLKAEAKTVIDGKGKVLSPGFIDAHSHHDLVVEQGESCFYTLEQGITTIIGGMCGLSPMPISEKHLESCLRVTGTDHSEESRKARFDTAAYLDFVNRPTGANMAYLVGHGNLRACVVGYADRKLTKEEQAEMEEREYEISAGGGAVTIKINGKKEILSIDLDPEIVDPDDVETLTDLLVAGVNEAIKRVETTNAAEMEKITGSMNLPGMF